MKRFLIRFRQFGGFELLKEYIRKGVFIQAVGQFLLVLFHKKSLTEADGAIRRMITPQLRDEFFPVMKELEKKYEGMEWTHERSNKVWFCWLQGLEHAPKLVKVCYESLKKNLRERDIIVLTSENIQEYVSLPDFIEEKYRKGVMTAAHYADMLRLELLIAYGGTWIDSTVYCSDNNYPEELLDNDLFVYQQTNRLGKFVGLSNWFLTSDTNNQLLLILRDMMYEYWRRYNCVIDYFIFHQFFGMIAEYHQKEIDQMPKHSNRWPLTLATWLGDSYDEGKYLELCRRTSFHKLTYRLKKDVEREGTFYNVLIQGYE